MKARVVLAGAVLGCGVALSADARAQGAGTADAEELFKQGRAALEAKDYANACPKLAASLQIERAVGTLISLAECEEATNRLAGALSHWQEAADFADASNDRLKRGPYARQRFAQLDPRVPRLIVHLARGAPRDTTLKRDDVALGSAGFDVALPVELGAHVITVTAPGHDSKTYPVKLAEGERKTLEVDPLPEAVAPPNAAPGVGVRQAGAGEEPPPMTQNRGSQRTIAYVVGGIGVVGLAVGTYFGLQSFSKWSQAKSDCSGGCPDGSPGRNERSDALTDGTISTVAFVAGGVAVAAGAVLLFTAPRPSTMGRLTVEPVAGPLGGGIRMRGSF